MTSFSAGQKKENTSDAVYGPKFKGMGVWMLVRQSLQQSIPVMLLYVLESNGSSPGRQGFAMAVTANGLMEGSIGGGIMEHKLVEMAREMLNRVNAGMPVASSIRKQVHDKSASKDQSGMICSGDQSILLYPVPKNEMEQVENIVRCLEQCKNGLLEFSPGGMHFSATIPGQDYLFNMNSQLDWLYRERLGYKHHLYIVGGGHCALAFSKLMSGMDFYIHLFENRDGLNTLEQNIYVHEKKMLKDYKDLAGLVLPGKKHFVIVMTFGYRTDDVAIRALLGKSFGYFGVLGSAKKMEKLFSDYIAEGIGKDLLQNIHAPVGLAINSQTPEEIAVSIAAEIILVKNR